MATTTSPSPPSSPPDGPVPTQTFHPNSGLVPKIPTPALFGSVAGGAHYSGAKVEHTNSDIARASFSNGGATVELDEKRKLIMDDLKEVGLLLPCCH